MHLYAVADSGGIEPEDRTSAIGDLLVIAAALRVQFEDGSENQEFVFLYRARFEQVVEADRLERRTDMVEQMTEIAMETVRSLRFVIDQRGSGRIDHKRYFGASGGIVAGIAVPQFLHPGEIVEDRLRLIVAAPHVEPPERGVMDQRQRHFPAHPGDIFRFVLPVLEFKFDDGGEVRIEAVGALVALVQVIPPETAHRPHRHHEAAAVADHPVLVSAGADQKVDAAGSEQLLIGEVAFFNPVAAEFEDVAVECSEFDFTIAAFADAVREFNDCIADQIGSEAPVADAFGIGGRIAQHIFEPESAAPGAGRDVVRNGQAFEAAVLPITFEFVFPGAAVAEIHPLVGAAAGGDVGANPVAVTGFQKVDDRVAVSAGRLLPARHGNRFGEIGIAVAIHGIQLPGQPERRIQIKHDQKFRVRIGRQQVVELPFDRPEIVCVEPEPVRRIFAVRLSQRIAGVGRENRHGIDSDFSEPANRFQFRPE